jgi:hypothetical protein
VKIKVATPQYRDRPLLVDLFDTATALYEQHAKDANLDDRLKEQFVRQADRGKALTMQLWRQKDLHETTFDLEEDETDRWLIINMITTSVDVLVLAVDDMKNLTAKALYRRRLARAEELREAIEDAAGR